MILCGHVTIVIFFTEMLTGKVLWCLLQSSNFGKFDVLKLQAGLSKFEIGVAHNLFVEIFLGQFYKTNP